jgi:tRNA pseudouridine38-40 synthase
VQSTLEQAISQVTQEPIEVLGSGRTDAGAHAVHQVIAFSTITRLDSASLVRAVNACLPRDIAVTAGAEVPLTFNPRRDASSRTYRYLIWNRAVRSPFMLGRSMHVEHRLDERAMDAAAQILVGRHDLGAFIPVRTEGGRERTIYAAGCSRESDLICIDIEATGFMRQMVRAIAGTLIHVGAGKMTHAQFGEVLSGRDRASAGDTAPACGLYLLRVRYPDLDFRVQVQCSSCLPRPVEAVAATLREDA